MCSEVSLPPGLHEVIIRPLHIVNAVLDALTSLIDELESLGGVGLRLDDCCDGQGLPSEVRSVDEQTRLVVLGESESNLDPIGVRLERCDHDAVEVVADVDGLDVGDTPLGDQAFVKLRSQGLQSGVETPKEGSLVGGCHDETLRHRSADS